MKEIAARAEIDLSRSYAYGARTVGDRLSDALADPRRRVCGELETAPPVEQLDGAHQAPRGGARL